MTALQIEIYPNRSELIARSYALVLERIRAAIAARGRCFIALAGGSTPKPLYEAMVQADIPWSQLHVFWGDERYVPIDHPDSNAGAAKAAWLDHVAIPKEHIYVTPTHFDDSAEAARQYEQTVRQVMGDSNWPKFDLMLLGMGDDGHTASLFPHTPALDVGDRLVTVGDKGGTARITFTVPLINHSRCVLFIVAGSNKQAALTEVFSPEGDDRTFPSKKIQPQGELWWLLDAEAGEPVRDLPVTQIF